jgi:hypothetical protein
MRQIILDIDCGETTCAKIPGKFCEHVGSIGFGQHYVCRLFPMEDKPYTPLEDVGDWLMRCEKCLLYDSDNEKF